MARPGGWGTPGPSGKFARATPNPACRFPRQSCAPRWSPTVAAAPSNAPKIPQPGPVSSPGRWPDRPSRASATVAAPSQRNGAFSLVLHMSWMGARSLGNPSCRQCDPQRVAGRFGASVSLDEDKAKAMPNGVGDVPVLKRAAPLSVGDPGAWKRDPPTMAGRFRGPTCSQQPVAWHVAAWIRSEPFGAPCSRGDAFLAGHHSGFIGGSRCPSCGEWEKPPGVDFKGRPLMKALRPCKALAAGCNPGSARG